MTPCVCLRSVVAQVAEDLAQAAMIERNKISARGLQVEHRASATHRDLARWSKALIDTIQCEGKEVCPHV